jgi:transglutaminase-like putative cysteine protease
MLIPNTHYEPAHNAAHTYYELGYGHYELYSGSTMSSPYAMRAEPRALAPAAVPLAARYRPARRPPPPRRPALSHSTARRSLQCTAAPPRLAAPLATSSLAAPLAAPLAALLTAPLRSLHRSPCPARRAARRAAR